MCDNTFRIQNFENIIYINDKKGNTVTFESRHASCFIITLTDKIRFTFEDAVIESGESGGIFIPEGIAYKNECLEQAQSIVINFSLFGSPAPCKLKPIDPKAAMKIYENISKYSYDKSRYAQYYILSQIYLLASELFDDKQLKGGKQLIAEKAFGKKSGARDVRTVIRREVEDNLTRLLVENAAEQPALVSVTAEDGELKLITA